MKLTPTLTDIFGSFDLCMCQDCRSVYSPAAYFVDLLEFLKKPTNIPFSKLVARRPDLVFIKLNCENTDTKLPYIDLVNEILESYVSLGTGKLNQSTAHDTANITEEELSVNPQYTLDSAYDKLREAVHSPDLPFDRPIEVARAYLEHLGTSRFEIMQAFQKAAGPDIKEPSDRALACEYLRISPEEFDIITGSIVGGMVSVGALTKGPWEFFGYSDEHVADGMWDQFLFVVPGFLRRSEIHYFDLVELLKTRFINPGQSADPLPSNLIVLFNAKAPCDLSSTVIRHLGPSNLDLLANEWFKMHRFLRLWRKLGWSMQDIDKTLHALGAEEIDEAFVMKLASLEQLRKELNVPIVPLLSLWALIDTFGDESLYSELFLNKAVINPIDGAFELNPDGSNLDDTGLFISDHLTAIQSALRINSTDLEEIRVAVGLDDDLDSPTKREMNLENLSILYRHVLLARALKLKARDLIILKSLTGIDPFQPGNPGPTLAFVRIVRKVQKSGFSVAELDYIYRHISEPTKSFSPLQDQLVRLSKKLHDGLNSIAIDNIVVSDPVGELTKKKLGTVWQSDTVDPFIAMINGSTTYDVTLTSLPELAIPNVLGSKLSYDTVSQELQFTDTMSESEKALLMSLSLQLDFRNAIEELSKTAVDGISNKVHLPNPPEVSIVDSQQNKISYDGTTKIMRFVGPMTVNQQQILLSLSTDTGYQSAINELYQQPREFVSNTNAGFLDISDAVANLLDVDAPREEKYHYILSQLLPYLRDSLSRSLITKALSDELKLDTAMTGLLLETVVKSRNDVMSAAMMDYLALLNTGLSATYFSASDLTGNTVARLDPNIAFAWAAAPPDPVITLGTPFSVRWTGKMLAQYNESYTFYIHAGEDGARLWVDNQLLFDQFFDQADIEHTVSIELKAGELYDITLEYAHFSGDAGIQLRWGSPSTPKDFVPQTNLYPGDTYSTFVAAFSLLHKIALLLSKFQFEVNEVKYLSNHGGDFAVEDPQNSANVIPLDLNSFPLDPSASNTAFFRHWERLYDVFALKKALPNGELGLFDIFKNAEESATPSSLTDSVTTLVIGATDWNATDLTTLVSDPGIFQLSDSDLTNEKWLQRLQTCMEAIRKAGVSAKQLHDWAKAKPDSNQANNIIHTVKAKYDDMQWLAVGKSLNDSLREKQKAALLAYILADDNLIMHGITDANKLFEHFLIDVNMSPCFMTSRIKQAISSVQLFIHRCLMDLEEGVAPDLIDAQQWEWMQNYRVWEANRKVFLYPENWIEPELRDDKSPFFKDFEAQLLQNEITKESVESAYVTYLEKLDEVAHLEVCGLYRHDKDDTDVVHVFGRTHNNPPVYYYRQFHVKTETWTTWEKVPLDIEGNLLIPVVYNRRLYLFWPTIVEKPDPDQDLSGPPLVAEKTDEEIQYENDSLENAKLQAAHDQWSKDAARWDEIEQILLDEAPDVSPFFTKEPPKPKNLGEKPEKAPPPTIEPPTTLWEIKLSWSQYWQNRWTPKQSSKSVLSVKRKDGYPAERDISFRVFEDKNNVLWIWGLCRTKQSPEPYYADTVVSIGSFYLSGCQKEVKTVNPYGGFSFITPDRSRLSYMRFDEESGDTLTLYGSTPYLKSYAILHHTPSDFQLVHPPVSVAPTSSDFQDVAYPFFYQDEEGHRTYFAMPTLDKEPPPRGDATNPSIEIIIEAEDAVMSALKYIDKGDPPPFESRAIEANAIEGTSLSTIGGH